MPENTALQPLVDKIQGAVGGYVKLNFDSLKPSNRGGDTNDYS